MALTEVNAEIAADLSHDPYADETTDSVQMINSLREIPLVDTSADFDSIISDRAPNLAASIFSTPRYERPNSAVPSKFDDQNTFDGSKYPFSDIDTSTEEECDEHDETYSKQNSDSPQDSLCNSANASLRAIGEYRRESVESIRSRQATPPSPRASTSSKSFASARASPVSHSLEQQYKQLDHIAKGAVALDSMSEFIEVWAPTAHSVVITAAALQRDAAAFASTIDRLLSSRSNLDPQSFANQFYQLREAYASLVSSSSIAAGGSGSNTGTRASTKPSKADPAATRNQDLETTWDDRQLVDSFMTLLRTSPGFIASAFSQLTPYEAATFCSADDSSALNILFYGVLGTADQYRPDFFADLLACTVANKEVLIKALLSKFLALSIGSFTQSSTTVLERYLRATIAMSQQSDIPDFEPVLHACIPLGFARFVTAVLETGHDPTFLTLAVAQLEQYVYSLITSPHQFGVLTDTYIGERLGKDLENIAQKVCNNLVNVIERLRHSERCEVLFVPDELVVVKGSDILQLYQSLLPARGGLQGVPSNSGSESDEDEWCLENIRSDLIPVIRELAHSAGHADGWQVFKVGADGLVTDLGNDMGLAVEENDDEELLRTVCDAVRKRHGSLEERLIAARNDAELRGDHIAVLQLSELTHSPDMEPFINQVDQLVAAQKQRCRVLRRTLEQAAKDQHRERERLVKLLSILDMARMHVWYEAEVRPCSLYYRARESLKMLYPYARGDSEDSDKLMDPSLVDLSYGPVSSTKSRRLSILSSHSAPESPFYSREIFPKPKLTDREVDTVLIYMRRYHVRRVCPAEELFPRALVEIGLLSRSLIDRDHIAGYITYRRDRHYQTQYSQAQQTSGSVRQQNKRMSQHRRSSLGLFDFFDSGSYMQSAAPVTLHSSTSTQFLGLASSHDSLRSAGRPEDAKSGVGPPTAPSLAQVTGLLLSDLGRTFMSSAGTETDYYMQQTGRMLLEGDGIKYQPLLDDLSKAISPESKLACAESLTQFARAQLQRKQGMAPSRSDVIHELGRVFGREPGTLYRDLETISFLIHPSVLERSEAFTDVCDAAQNVLESVVARSTDYAARFLRYYLETKTTAAPQMSNMGIADSVAIWAFCAKCGNREAQRKLAELYMHFPNLLLEIRPLSRPANIVDGIEPSLIRDAIAQHWFALASQI